MLLGSHNSWSYISPTKWWMKLFSFTVRCQNKTIKEQYEKYGVRCFDLRLRYFNGDAYIVHNEAIYGKFWGDKGDILYWLNAKKDVVIRVLHDVRLKKNYTIENIESFKKDCRKLEEVFPDIKFWCGKNLYNWENDYVFNYNPNCIERYSSVCPPKIIDDWWPFIYAKLNNKKIYKQYPIDNDDSSILLIDYVNIK